MNYCVEEFYVKYGECVCGWYMERNVGFLVYVMARLRRASDLR